MKTVIYLDVLLLINFLIAYLLLQTVGLLCSVPVGFFRAVFAACAASLSTLILLAPELSTLVSLLFKLGTAFLVVRIAFQFSGWRPFFRQSIWFFLMNIALAGIVLLAISQGYVTNMQTNNLSVYINLSPVLLLVCTLAVYILMRLILFLFGSPSPTECWSLHLCYNQQPLPDAVALFDTGFLLQDPLGGRPALLVSYPFFSSSLPVSVAKFLQDFFDGKPVKPPEGVNLRMVPCKTATGCKTLPAVGGFSVELSHNQEVRRVSDALVVFSPQTLTDGSVQALFGTHFLQNTAKERSSKLCSPI